MFGSCSASFVMSWLMEKVGRVRMADIAKSDYEVENDFTAETVSMTCSVYSLVDMARLQSTGGVVSIIITCSSLSRKLWWA